MRHFPMEVGQSTSTLPSFAELTICAECGNKWPCAESRRPDGRMPVGSCTECYEAGFPERPVCDPHGHELTGAGWFCDLHGHKARMVPREQEPW